MREANTQSVFHAAEGSGAALLHELGLAMYVGAGLIFVVVMALAFYGALGRARRASVRTWVIGGGVVFPLITLSVLLVYSLAVGHAIEAPGHDADLRVEVIGKQWWWEVRYFDAHDEPTIVLANELHIPLGRTVRLELSTSDVIHSFWAPSLAGKVDMIPGRVTHLLLRADAPGVYRGQCAEYCGGQHALMSFHVVVEREEQFQVWLARQAEPASPPQEPELQLGYDMFFEGRCHTCHTVRGTPADGRDGPDLTHVGSRRALAAGVLSNHIGSMAGWIAGAQQIKPGNAMPSADVYSGEELRALAAWLGSLE